jgi:hypothetical protein
MKLNDGQIKAKKAIEEWLKDEKSKLFSLNGAAGCGKTYLLSQIDFPENTIGVAPTHQAKDILVKSLKIECKTIASVLFSEEIYVEDRAIFKPNKDKWKFAVDYDLLIIDEASMISPQTFEDLKQLYCYSKILFVGDKAQLPSIDDCNFCVFDVVEGVTLTENMRSGESNPILSLANLNRNSNTISLIEEDLKDEKGFVFYDKNKYLDLYKEKLIDVSVCYTNKVKDYINKKVHDWFYPNEEYGIGEQLISNENIDYYLVNKKVHYRIYNSDRLIVTDNLGIKDKTVKFEYDVYDRVTRETIRYELFSDTFKHHLLETDKGMISLLCDSDKFRFNKFLNFIKKYVDNRVFSWADWHKTKKSFNDIVYGYACSSHKVQGSSYDNVAVIYTDIESNKNKKVSVNSFYTAITRARKKVYILK